MRLVKIRKFFYRCKNRIAHCQVEAFHAESGENVVVATELGSNFRGPEVASNLEFFIPAIRHQLDCAEGETFRLFERWTPDSYVPINEDGIETNEIVFCAHSYKPSFKHYPEDQWTNLYRNRRLPQPKTRKRPRTS